MDYWNMSVHFYTIGHGHALDHFFSNWMSVLVPLRDVHVCTQKGGFCLCKHWFGKLESSGLTFSTLTLGFETEVSPRLNWKGQKLNLGTSV